MIFKALTNEMELKSLPLIAVDIGYSKNRKTCGVAWQKQTHVEVKSKNITFGDAITEVSKLIREMGSCVLVLEAVLSTYHAPNGNPEIRGEFEKGRGWYCGPGVVTFAAAMRFLSQLAIEDDSCEVFLAEAFLSNKKEKTSHEEDAKTIAEKFWSTETKELNSETEPICDLVDKVPSVRMF